MRAFVMAAGVGSRLEPLTLAVPKPMVPICNIPVMEYNIRLLKKYGIKDITANLHYFPEQIEDYFDSGSNFGVKMIYSFEKELMGTAGGVKKMAKVSKYSGDGPVIILSADVLTNIDLGRLLAYHKKKKAAATIALIEVDDPSEFGVVVTDKSGRIRTFQEKPKKEEALSSLVNSGIYILEKKVVDLIPPDAFYDFGKQLFPLLVENGLPFYAYHSKAYWKDVGNVGNYKSANFDLLKRPLLVGKGSVISKKAKISGKVVIGDRCVIEDGAHIKDSIIWSDTVIGANVTIVSNIIGSNCNIGRDSFIKEGSVIANEVVVKPGSSIVDEPITPGRVI